MFVFVVFVLKLDFLITCLPLGYIRRITENHKFNDVENYLPKFEDHYPSNELEDDLLVKYRIIGENERKMHDKTKSVEDLTTVAVFSGLDTTTTFAEQIVESTTIFDENNTSTDLIQFEIDFPERNGTYRSVRQESNDTKSDPEFESQEDGSSEEEGNMITGLLSTFLGGLSRPDGSIDLEAIVGLLGSLSVQNDDGTYDFQGLTDLLRGLFGGGGDEGGGSDFGAFVGGILGAVIKGVANPPGAKGAGIFTGKVVAGVLPALSGPAPPAEGMDENKPPPETLDSGGFLSGLLKTILGSSSGNSQGEEGGSSFNIFKIVFSLISSVFSSSSKSH